jgi:hypothetical protein
MPVAGCLMRQFPEDFLRQAGVTQEQLDAAWALLQREKSRERVAKHRAQGRALCIIPAPVEKAAPIPSAPRVRIPTGVVPGAIPEDWRPDSTGLMMADQVGLSGADLDRELSQFRDYYLSEGKLKADWNASFRCWLRNYKPKGSRNGRYETERDRRSREWREVLDDAKAFASGST